MTTTTHKTKLYSDLVEKLVPLLHCPACQSTAGLSIERSAPASALPIPLHPEILVCRACAREYPVTDDYIPIMWTTNLQRALSGAKESTLAANIAIYEAISDDYREYSRQEPDIAVRVRNATVRALEGISSDPVKRTSGLRHLDFGCGPGHVLGWLRDFGFMQFGIDVSLRNLRNARHATACSVVCGDASALPFADGTMDLVTESSALHHIPDWRAALREATRVCRRPGAIIIDSEPSTMQLAWSRAAVAVFNSRFYPYKLLSYVCPDKYIFRDTARAKRNLLAEIHHQPGTGFPLGEVHQIFAESGYRPEIVCSPSPTLISVPNPGWKGIVLNLLSGRNPWNSDYGPFTAICVSDGHPHGQP